jgi:integrase
MARTVRDTKLATREARRKLAPRGRPYWRTIEEGLHVGYRKPKAGSGKWLVRHYIGDQAYEVRVLAIADDLSDADGVMILDFKQAQERARTEMVQRAVAGVPTVRTAVEAYCDWLDTHRNSGKDSRYKADALILPALGDVRLDALTTKQITDWQGALAKTPARVRTKPGAEQQHRAALDDGEEELRRRRCTANRVLVILRAALNKAWHEGVVADDSAWRRVKPFKDVDASRTRYLTIPETKRLINASDDDFRPLVQAALLTGCRYGELRRLRVRNFHSDARTVEVRNSKTGKSRISPHVHLTDEAVAFFQAITAGRAGEDLMFRRVDGAPWLPANQSDRIKKACRRARITPPITFHGLRHTHCSHAVMAGVALIVVSQNLGHTSTKMIEKHYGHLAPSFVAAEIKRAGPAYGITVATKVREIA